VGRVKEARPEAQPTGSNLIHIQTASFSILQNGMLDWRGSPNFGKRSASNKFRNHGPQPASLPELDDFTLRMVAVRALEGALIVPRHVRVYASKHHRRSALRAG
jgi:hypothetical protein